MVSDGGWNVVGVKPTSNKLTTLQKRWKDLNVAHRGQEVDVVVVIEVILDETRHALLLVLLQELGNEFVEERGNFSTLRLT